MMEKFKKGALWFLKSYLWIMPLLLIIDIVTKQVAQAYLSQGSVVTAIPHLIGFTLVYNDGAAFGLFGGLDDLPRRIILISMSTIGAIIMIFCFWKYYKKMNAWTKAALIMMIPGCLGNFIDRCFYKDGLVIDFIKFLFWKNFAVFNFADALLVVGTFVLIIAVIIEEVNDHKKDKQIEKEVEGMSHSANISNDSQENNIDTVETKKESEVKENTSERDKDETNLNS